MNKILVIIPTYNEAQNIEKLISKITALELDLNFLIIDDSSPDGTADIVKNLINNKSLRTSKVTKMSSEIAKIQKIRNLIN